MQRVVVYTTTHCGFCWAAKRHLTRRGIPFEELDVTGDDAAREELLIKAGGRRTVPQIFIDERPIGGYTELVALDKAGGLDRLLAGRGPETVGESESR
jgi:glutaredoxin 3